MTELAPKELYARFMAFRQSFLDWAASKTVCELDQAEFNVAKPVVVLDDDGLNEYETKRDQWISFTQKLAAVGYDPESRILKEPPEAIRDASQVTLLVNPAVSSRLVTKEKLVAVYRTHIDTLDGLLSKKSRKRDKARMEQLVAEQKAILEDPEEKYRVRRRSGSELKARIVIPAEHQAVMKSVSQKGIFLHDPDGSLNVVQPSDQLRLRRNDDLSLAGVHPVEVSIFDNTTVFRESEVRGATNSGGANKSQAVG